MPSKCPNSTTEEAGKGAMASHRTNKQKTKSSKATSPQPHKSNIKPSPMGPQTTPTKFTSTASQEPNEPEHMKRLSKSSIPSPAKPASKRTFTQDRPPAAPKLSQIGPFNELPEPDHDGNSETRQRKASLSGSKVANCPKSRFERDMVEICLRFRKDSIVRHMLVTKRLEEHDSGADLLPGYVPDLGRVQEKPTLTEQVKKWNSSVRNDSPKVEVEVEVNTKAGRMSPVMDFGWPDPYCQGLPCSNAGSDDEAGSGSGTSSKAGTRKGYSPALWSPVPSWHMRPGPPRKNSDDSDSDTSSSTDSDVETAPSLKVKRKNVPRPTHCKKRYTHAKSSPATNSSAESSSIDSEYIRERFDGSDTSSECSVEWSSIYSNTPKKGRSRTSARAADKDRKRKGRAKCRKCHHDNDDAPSSDDEEEAGSYCILKFTPGSIFVSIAKQMGFATCIWVSR